MSLISFNKHHKFLAKYLKKYNFILNEDGINLSLVNLEKDMYLAVVRYIAPVAAYFGEEYVPGNYSGKENYIKQQLLKKGVSIENIAFGKNFIWNNWTDLYLDNSVFFVVKISSVGSIKIVEEIKPVVVHNMPIFYKGEKMTFKYSDIRLFKSNDKIFCYDGFISGLYEIIIKNKIIYSLLFDNTNKIKYTFYVNKNFCNNVRNYDKNWAYIETKGDDMVFLNWYENGYVTTVEIPPGKQDCKKNNIIKMNGDIIRGDDKEIKTGLFSFGVPFLKLPMEYSGDKSIDYEGISVGHIKIPNRDEVFTNRNILEFFGDIKKLSGVKSFVRHASYDYLIYYIYLVRRGEIYTMKISNAFLLVDSKRKYTFSINYPMTISKMGSSAMITLGIGDYYSYIYMKNIKDIIKECVHDISNFKIDEYKYNIILHK